MQYASAEANKCLPDMPLLTIELLMQILEDADKRFLSL
jgi:hypothetical protein